MKKFLLALACFPSLLAQAQTLSNRYAEPAAVYTDPHGTTFTTAGLPSPTQTFTVAMNSSHTEFTNEYLQGALSLIGVAPGSSDYTWRMQNLNGTLSVQKYKPWDSSRPAYSQDGLSISASTQTGNCGLNFGVHWAPGTNVDANGNDMNGFQHWLQITLYNLNQNSASTWDHVNVEWVSDMTTVYQNTTSATCAWVDGYVSQNPGYGNNPTFCYDMIGDAANSSGLVDAPSDDHLMACGEGTFYTFLVYFLDDFSNVVAGPTTNVVISASGVQWGYRITSP